MEPELGTFVVNLYCLRALARKLCVFADVRCNGACNLAFVDCTFRVPHCRILEVLHFCRIRVNY
jgi:hypothetical protein